MFVCVRVSVCVCMCGFGKFHDEKKTYLKLFFRISLRILILTDNDSFFLRIETDMPVSRMR